MISGAWIAAIDRAVAKVTEDFPAPEFRHNVDSDEILVLERDGDYGSAYVTTFCIACHEYHDTNFHS